jgi:hypothetical protein
MIFSAAAALLVLIVLTLLFGDPAAKIDKNPIPKELPRPAVGGGDADLDGDLASQAADLPLGSLLSGDLPAADNWNAEPEGELRPGSAIENPPSVQVTNSDLLLADDLVIGVALKDTARAYPLKFLAAPGQEVVNDRLGDEPVTVTWNPALRSAVVFHNPASELSLVFRSTGQTWKSDMLLQDQATESYWSQSLGRCVRGQLLGTPLRGIPSVVCTWKAWAQSFPQTSICQLPATAPPEAITTSTAASSNARKTGQILVLCPEGEREVTRAELFANRVLNTTAGTRYAAIFYDDLADSIRALDPMLVVKPLTFELRGLQFTLIGSNSSWNIFNGSAEEEGVTARPLSPLLVIELPSELKNFRRPIRNGEPLPSASIPGPNSTQGN